MITTATENDVVREVDCSRDKNDDECRANIGFQIDPLLTDADSTVRRNNPLRCLRDYQENIVSENHDRNS